VCEGVGLEDVAELVKDYRLGDGPERQERCSNQKDKEREGQAGYGAMAG
jgi:hypothetical protein